MVSNVLNMYSWTNSFGLLLCTNSSAWCGNVAVGFCDNMQHSLEAYELFGHLVMYIIMTMEHLRLYLEGHVVFLLEDFGIHAQGLGF